MITTACNAATMPVIGPYLDELQKWLASEGFGGSVLMMLSNGGVVSADDAARSPIRLVESGPAAGALAGSWFARRLGEDRLLCFDMGGTTAKSCLIVDGEPELTNTFEVARMYRFKKGSGYPVSVPSVDLVEIGAGGGSQARVDDLGLLKVGPESAGADPGPACYGLGGTKPAVTDADLELGFLDADFFLGGDMALDMAATACCPRLGRNHARPVHGRHGRRHPRTGQPEHGRCVADACRRDGRRPARRHDDRVRWCGARARLRRRRAARVTGGHLPRQRQRAVRVRHAGHAGAHRPWPQHGAPDGHGVRGGARCVAGRTARGGSPCSRCGRCRRWQHPVPVRRRRPIHRPGQRDHDLGRRGRSLAGHATPRSCSGSKRTTGRSTG